MNEQKILNSLLMWLGAYVVVFIIVGAWAGKLTDVVPVLTHLISGFAGAAFTIMRLGRDKDPKD
jgi:hypothetical protein